VRTSIGVSAYWGIDNFLFGSRDRRKRADELIQLDDKKEV